MAVGYKYLIYAVVLALLASGLYWRGHVNGVNGEKVRSDQIIADMTKAAQKAKDAADAKAVAVEKLTNAQLAELSDKYQKEIKDEKDAADARIAQYRSNAVRMRVAVQSCSSEVPGNPATGPVPDGAGTAELSPEAAAGAESEADRADQVVNKLTALQEYVKTILRNYQ